MDVINKVMSGNNRQNEEHIVTFNRIPALQNKEWK
jgi:hypothetical protein